MSEWRWTDEEGTEAVLIGDRLSLFGKSSLKAGDGTVAVGVDLPRSFDFLMEVADRILEHDYPEDIFPDSPAEDEAGDPGPQLVRALRRCRRARAQR